MPIEFLPAFRILCASAFLGFTVGMHAADGLKLSWTNNLLTVSGANLPGGKLDIWYLEAFCRKGSAQREWGKTTFSHKTELVSASRDGRRLRFLTKVQPDVEVTHELRAGEDEVEFRFEFKNQGRELAGIEWFQPACIRVERFTARGQSNYTERSFIFTERGLTTFAQTARREEALYRGGQVYVPKGIPLDDANPRPISADQPVNGLIG